jgi:hypothetical protein
VIVDISRPSVYEVYMEGEDMIVKGTGVFHRLEDAPGFLRDYIGSGCSVQGFFDEQVFVIMSKVN